MYKYADSSDIPYLNYILSESFDISKDDSTPESLRYHMGYMVLDPRVRIMMPSKQIVLLAKEEEGGAVYEAHVVSLPTYKGNIVEVIRSYIVWFLKENESTERLVCRIPKSRRDVQMFAYSCGFRRIGVIPLSVTIKEIVQDIIIYEIRREDICLW